LEEQTVEDVRNVEGGTKQAWDACDVKASESKSWCEWTPRETCRDGGRNPKEGARRREATGGLYSRTLEGNQAHERMNP